jgi:hypothetical protein
MAPPTSYGAESNEAFIGYQLDDETNFVHVPGKHDPRGFGLPFFPTDNAPQPVLLDRGDPVKVLPDDFANFVFIPRDAMGFRQLSKQFHCPIGHAGASFLSWTYFSTIFTFTSILSMGLSFLSLG